MQYYIDTNILVYAQNEESEFFESSRALLNDFLFSGEISISQIVLNEFYSIITDSRKISEHWSANEASEYIDELSLFAVIHAVNEEIYNQSIRTAADYKIKKYGIYDHQLACSMQYYGIKKIITANKKDFEKYAFIEEIIVPEKKIKTGTVPEMRFIPYGRQYIDEDDINAVITTLRSDFLTQGPAVTAFEKAICDYTGAEYCVAVANATAGLHIAVAALDIKEGYEGITSPITFVASANCLVYNNLKPVFADINEKSYNIDPAEINNKINDKTKVLIPVHFAGRPCRMTEIKKIADDNKLYIIEDAAHAIGGCYPDGSKVGCCRYSDMTVFSFHPVKTMTTGEGGAITTNSRELYERLILLRSHGITRDENKLAQNPGPWYYEMQSLGFNFRITDIQASLGISQLAKLVFFKKRRDEIIESYNAAFADIPWITTPIVDDSDPCFHLYVVKIDFNKLDIHRAEFMNDLRGKNIGTQVLYIPVHTQPFYRESFGYKQGDYPVAEAYYEQALALPLFPAMSDEDVEFVIREFVNRKS